MGNPLPISLRGEVRGRNAAEFLADV